MQPRKAVQGARAHLAASTSQGPHGLPSGHLCCELGLSGAAADLHFSGTGPTFDGLGQQNFIRLFLKLRHWPPDFNSGLPFKLRLMYQSDAAKKLPKTVLSLYVLPRKAVQGARAHLAASTSQGPHGLSSGHLCCELGLSGAAADLHYSGAGGPQSS